MQNGKKSFFSLTATAYPFKFQRERDAMCVVKYSPFVISFFSERLILLKDYLLARLNSKQFHQPDRRNLKKMKLYVRPCVAVVVANSGISPSYYTLHNIHSCTTTVKVFEPFCCLAQE